MGQPLLASRAVIALDIEILLRLTWQDKVDAYAALDGPSQGHRTDVLREVIAMNDPRITSSFDNHVERSDRLVRLQREEYLDIEPFSFVGVDDVQKTDAMTVSQLVMHDQPV